MFIAALFTKAKTWKQPKHPSIDEWVKVWYIHTMEYCSVLKKKNGLLPFAKKKKMDGPGDYHTKGS